MKKEGILRELDHGLIVSEKNLFKFGNNHELQKTNVILFRKLLRDCSVSDQQYFRLRVLGRNTSWSP